MSNNSTNKKRKVLGGNIIIVFLASLPYLFHFYQFVDAEDYVDSDFVNSLTEPFGGDLYVALWVFFQKLFPFLITLIWFLTCKHWWYHAILIPMGMYAIQVYTVLDPSIEFVDQRDLYFMVPVVIGAIFLSYTARDIVRARLDEQGSKLDEEMHKPSDKWI